MIQQMIDDMTENMGKEPQFRQYRFLSQKPLFYYKYSDIAYTRDSKYLYISMNVPMMDSDTATFDMYQTDVYPVPLTTGTSVAIENRLTRLSNLSPHIAVSKNREMYFEIDTPMLATCRDMARIYMCSDTGLPAITKAVSYKSCTYGVFTDNTDVVRTKCTTEYEHRGLEFGSAKQIDESGLFLMHAGKNELILAHVVHTSTSAPYPNTSAASAAVVGQSDYYLSYVLDTCTVHVLYLG